MEVIFSTYPLNCLYFLYLRIINTLFLLKNKKQRPEHSLYKTYTISENDKAAASYADESEGQSGYVSQQHPDTLPWSDAPLSFLPLLNQPQIWLENPLLSHIPTSVHQSQLWREVSFFFLSSVSDYYWDKRQFGTHLLQSTEDSIQQKQSINRNANSNNNQKPNIHKLIFHPHLKKRPSIYFCYFSILIYLFLVSLPHFFLFFLISHPFYTHQSTHVNPDRPIHHTPTSTPATFPPWCPYVCPLHLCLNFCPANQFICTIFLGSTYMR